MSQKPYQNAYDPLYTKDHKRKYINEEEREAFIAVASKAPPLVRMFCLTLVYTGCRISEARYLRKEDLQFRPPRLTFKTLKRRDHGVSREVPIPDHLADAFQKIHFCSFKEPEVWMFSDDSLPPPRIACYRWVKDVMAKAGIKGVQATPHGLRHGFAVHADGVGVSPFMLKEWMGHASIETTLRYAKAIGIEEALIAARMW